MARQSLHGKLRDASCGPGPPLGPFGPSALARQTREHLIGLQHLHSARRSDGGVPDKLKPKRGSDAGICLSTARPPFGTKVAGPDADKAAALRYFGLWQTLLMLKCL